MRLRKPWRWSILFNDEKRCPSIDGEHLGDALTYGHSKAISIHFFSTEVGSTGNESNVIFIYMNIYCKLITNPGYEEMRASIALFVMLVLAGTLYSASHPAWDCSKLKDPMLRGMCESYNDALTIPDNITAVMDKRIALEEKLLKEELVNTTRAIIYIIAIGGVATAVVYGSSAIVTSMMFPTLQHMNPLTFLTIPVSMAIVLWVSVLKGVRDFGALIFMTASLALTLWLASIVFALLY